MAQNKNLTIRKGSDAARAALEDRNYDPIAHHVKLYREYMAKWKDTDGKSWLDAAVKVNEKLIEYGYVKPRDVSEPNAAGRGAPRLGIAINIRPPEVPGNDQPTIEGEVVDVQLDAESAPTANKKPSPDWLD